MILNIVTFHVTGFQRKHAMADISINYSYLRRHAGGIIAFAMVARHGQVSSAADALHMSQPGLSQRVRLLEEALGTQLFERGPRGVRLSPSGADLMARIEPHLGALAGAFADFTLRDHAPKVLIAVDYAFASFWLMPRLARLRETIEAADISVLASQNPGAMAGVTPDLVVRMGRSGQGGETKLIGEKVCAVCSPGFLRSHPAITGPSDLSAMPLLSLSGVGDWFDWDGWFRHFGIVPPDRLMKTSFNTYDLVMQAAVDGHGVALGWHGLVDPMLDRGDLVRAVPDLAESDRGYFLRLGNVPASEAARSVHDWMAQAAQI